jgi:hypothetical protein
MGKNDGEKSRQSWIPGAEEDVRVGPMKDDPHIALWIRH